MIEEALRSDDPIRRARDVNFPAPFDLLCGALLTPYPGARPSARWICDAASASLANDASTPTASPEDRRERDARLVRATYLGVRRWDLEHANAVDDDTAPWLAAAVARAVRIRAITPSAQSLNPPMATAGNSQRSPSHGSVAAMARRIADNRLGSRMMGRIAMKTLGSRRGVRGNLAELHTLSA